jgi:hypothetical protein
MVFQSRFTAGPSQTGLADCSRKEARSIVLITSSSEHSPHYLREQTKRDADAV